MHTLLYTAKGHKVAVEIEVANQLILGSQDDPE